MAHDPLEEHPRVLGVQAGELDHRPALDRLARGRDDVQRLDRVEPDVEALGQPRRNRPIQADQQPPVRGDGALHDLVAIEVLDAQRFDEASLRFPQILDAVEVDRDVGGGAPGPRERRRHGPAQGRLADAGGPVDDHPPRLRLQEGERPGDVRVSADEVRRDRGDAAPDPRDPRVEQHDPLAAERDEEPGLGGIVLDPGPDAVQQEVEAGGVVGAAPQPAAGVGAGERASGGLGQQRQESGLLLGQLDRAVTHADGPHLRLEVPPAQVDDVRPVIVVQFQPVSAAPHRRDSSPQRPQGLAEPAHRHVRGSGPAAPAHSVAGHDIARRLRQDGEDLALAVGQHKGDICAFDLAGVQVCGGPTESNELHLLQISKETICKNEPMSRPTLLHVLLLLLVWLGIVSCEDLLGPPEDIIGQEEDDPFDDDDDDDDDSIGDDDDDDDAADDDDDDDAADDDDSASDDDAADDDDSASDDDDSAE